MYIKRIKILNYKGFRDSGWMEFGPRFNVVVGQNNSGKTAVLESIGLHTGENKPHRSNSFPKGYPLDPTSKFEFDLNVTGQELVEVVQKTRQQFRIPQVVGGSIATLDSLFGGSSIDVKLTAQRNIGFLARTSPSFASPLTEHENGFVVGSSEQLDQVIITGQYAGAPDDNIPSIVFHGAAGRFYVFKAERLNVGQYQMVDESILAPSAANLPAVLAHLLSRNPPLTREFYKNISSIFPTIKMVLVPNVGGQYRISIWSHDIDSQRDDLATFLEDSGAGIGQVLAILYVAMTMPPSVIAIDEPNSFLHPGATKKLLQILKQYPHQYIISTHSTDIISTVEPDTLHLVKWIDGESKVVALNRTEVRDMRLVLNDLGVGLSDVFAADKVIWVEGQTEQECFPKLASYKLRKIPLGLSFIAVHNTGDFEANDSTSRKIWELYKRLGDANGILPVAIAFSLDDEGRSAKEKADLRRETGGKMHFLPRRAYENYLLHPQAIAIVLNSYIEASCAVTDQNVIDWISANGAQFHDKHISPSGDTFERWLSDCDAAKLLKDLFTELSGKTVEYGKTKHSVEITEWLLVNDPDYLEELTNYVVGLIPGPE